MKWRDSVLEALKRIAERHGTRTITRHGLMAEEFEQIKSETATKGQTPTQTLSRVLQELRNEGLVYFATGRGAYLLLDRPIDAEHEELSDEALEFAIKHERLRLAVLPTGDAVILARQRRGQQQLRLCTLENYNYQCAVCDVTDEKLLVASHIVRWTDDPDARGHLSNIICLCKFHDALFEAGYFAFSDDLEVHQTSDNASNTVMVNLSSIGHFRPAKSYPPLPQYLKRHRERVGIA